MSQWRTTHGIRRGMTLAEIEALNGRPFKLYGFGFDYGGTTLDWNGGSLDKQAGGCTLTLRFTMREGADNAAVYVGEQELRVGRRGHAQSRAGGGCGGIEVWGVSGATQTSDPITPSCPGLTRASTTSSRLEDGDDRDKRGHDTRWALDE